MILWGLGERTTYKLSKPNPGGDVVYNKSFKMQLLDLRAAKQQTACVHCETIKSLGELHSKKNKFINRIQPDEPLAENTLTKDD